LALGNEELHLNYKKDIIRKAIKPHLLMCWWY